MRHLWIAALGATVACAGANSDDDLPAANPAMTLTAGDAVLEIPEGAIPVGEDPEQIKFKQAEPDQAIPDQYNVVSDIYQLKPHGFEFDLPVTLKLPYDGGSVGLATVWLESDEHISWSQGPPAADEDGLAVFDIDHFSFYAVIGPFADEDEDGWDTFEDCDDTDPNIYPGAKELCDGYDQDCDGVRDNGHPQMPFYPDNDGDGLGSLSGSISACAAPEGFVDNGTDCDDNDDEILGFPDDAELVDSKEDIRFRVDTATAGETLALLSGTYTQTDINLDVDITFMSACPGGAIFDGEDLRGPFIKVDGNAVVTGFVFSRAKIAQGAAIQVNGGSPTITGNVFEDSQATEYGGGIYVSEGSPAIYDNEFNQLDAEVDGGAIYVEELGEVLDSKGVAWPRENMPDCWEDKSNEYVINSPNDIAYADFVECL